MKIFSSRSAARTFEPHAPNSTRLLPRGTKLSAAVLALALALSGCASETITSSESTAPAHSASSGQPTRQSAASPQPTEAAQQPTVSAQDSEQTPTVTDLGDLPAENTDSSAAESETSQVRPGTVTTATPDNTAAEPINQPTAPTLSSDEASEALRILNTLPVKGRAPKTGYSRAQFGDAWSDTDHNGCDTRNDILNRDLTEKQHKNSRGCVVISGVLHDPYSGKVINFVRGQDTSAQVQIDHVVALSDAWQSGAQEISAQERLAFANDPENLLAVDGSANQQKSDSDAATWLPANVSFRCPYVARQIRVKAKYRLWVKPAEKDAMVNVLSSCGGSADAPAPAPVTNTPAAQDAHPAETQPPAPVPTFRTCTEAHAAGYQNIHRGEPGYAERLDRDHDGVACESR